MLALVFASFAGMFFGLSLASLSLFLILLVLVQRGKGGGLTGALGGPGGQSAFGTKAGDMFTKITAGTALIWIFLCAASVYTLGNARHRVVDNDTPAETPSLLGLDSVGDVPDTGADETSNADTGGIGDASPDDTSATESSDGESSGAETGNDTSSSDSQTSSEGGEEVSAETDEKSAE